MGRTPAFFALRWRRLLMVIAGIVAGQFYLYGPSLCGNKILLPLDFLADPAVYLPSSPATEAIRKPNNALSDLVYQWEPARQFAVSEFRAGRLPMWMPYQYAGVPFIWPKFSPFMLLECSTASPVIIAWTQLAAALVGGLGAYAFFRRALGVGFWAAVIPAWGFPVTGFFAFWQGFPTCAPVFWLPWQLLMVDGAVRRGSAGTVAGLGLTTGLVLVSGALDVGGQVLLVSGLYAVWCWIDQHRREPNGTPARRAILAVGLGWVLGFTLAAPYALPLLEYARTGVRMEHRRAGTEARPPQGLAVLPQVILPDIYGANRFGSLSLTNRPQVESPATTYTGILATLFLAPLAFARRERRSGNIFWSLLILLALSWSLDIPGFVQLLRLPGLNMMSHNRLVFAASFAILALTATGLDALLAGEVRPRRWFWLPISVVGGLAAWCVWRAIFLPEPIATQVGLAVAAGHPIRWVENARDVADLQEWFSWRFEVSAVLAVTGAIAWLSLWKRYVWPGWAVAVLTLVLMADLLWNASDRSSQCDPAFYYPRVPVLEEISRSVPGRIVAWKYLPADLAQTHGLRDVRGYDAVDPGRLMDLMMLAADAGSPKAEYAMTQRFKPRISLQAPDRLRMSPILDMLGVRYLIVGGVMPPGIRPLFQSPDYCVLQNTAALPRVFVPRHIRQVGNDAERLRLLASADFDARETGYVESPVPAPETCLGEASIASEIPTRIDVALKMQTAGVVVLSDLWDAGWNAYLNERRVPILRVNHAIRGVAVPPGEGRLEFRYEPARFRLGLYLAGAGALGLLTALGLAVRNRTKEKSPSLSQGKFRNDGA